MGIFIGDAKESKGYRVSIPERIILILRDVKFLWQAEAGNGKLQDFIPIVKQQVERQEEQPKIMELEFKCLRWESSTASSSSGSTGFD